MIVALCAMMINSFRITSNRESGNGRYDVQMLPLTKHFPGFLIEIKAEKDCSEEQLEALAQAALQQINDRSYSAEMQALGIKSIIKYGLAVSGKSARIAAEMQTSEYTSLFSRPPRFRGGLLICLLPIMYNNLRKLKNA